MLLKIIGIFALLLNFSVTKVANESLAITKVNSATDGFSLQKSVFGVTHLFIETNHSQQFIDEHPERLIPVFFISSTNRNFKKLDFLLLASKASINHSNFFVLYFTKEIIFPFHTFL